MDAYFWQKKWQIKDIGFHQAHVNPLLVKYFNTLYLGKKSRVFLPLCGKTLDIAWLLSQGCRVVGVELSKIAVDELFIELDMQPQIIKSGRLIRYSAKHIDIFLGDIFNVSAAILGSVDAIYDRAALVALPKNIRQQYTGHLMQITNRAQQLVICFEYDQSLMEGPPFSIAAEEIHQHYADNYNVRLLDSIDVAGGLKGVCAATENSWLLVSK